MGTLVLTPCGRISVTAMPEQPSEMAFLNGVSSERLAPFEVSFVMDADRSFAVHLEFEPNDVLARSCRA